MRGFKLRSKVLKTLGQSALLRMRLPLPEKSTPFLFQYCENNEIYKLDNSPYPDVIYELRTTRETWNAKNRTWDHCTSSIESRIFEKCFL